jgi:CRP-like cAMP-binding protein
MSLAQTLRAVPLFSQLRESDLEFLGPLFVEREYPRNRVIRFAHDPCDAFYVVLRGQVKVMLIAEDGREVVLSLVRQGDFFGEMTLLDDEPYAASVIASEDSRLLVLRRDDFREGQVRCGRIEPSPRGACGGVPQGQGFCEEEGCTQEGGAQEGGAQDDREQGRANQGGGERPRG